MRLVRAVSLAFSVSCLACSGPPSPPLPQPAELPSRPTGKGTFPSELSSHREAVERSKLDYISIKPQRASGTSPWSSKLRGTPYFPKGSAYPLDPEGKPLILLAQLNFAEMPVLDGYPSNGILQFFVSGADSPGQVWGSVLYDEEPFNADRYFASLQDQRFFRILYHGNPMLDASQLATPPRPDDDYILPIMDEARLAFEKKTEYVLIDDYRFERVFGKKAYELFSTFAPGEEDVLRRYIDFAHEWVPAKIGGYASFVQGDPRGTKPGEDWLLLLEIQSIDSSDGVEIMWGDSGVGGLFIRRADLAKRDFSKVAYYWDNH